MAQTDTFNLDARTGREADASPRQAGSTETPAGTKYPVAVVMVSEFIRNLMAGSRLAFMMPVEQRHFHTGARQVVLAMAAFMGAYALTAFVMAEPERWFNPYGLDQLAALCLAITLGALATGRVRRDSGSAGTVLVMLAAALASQTLLFALTAMALKPDDPEAVHRLFTVLGWIWVLWWIPIFFRVMKIALAADRVHATKAAGLFAAIGLIPILAMPHVPLWYTSPNRAAEIEPLFRINVENTFYDQARLVDDAIRPLADQRPGLIDLYFVGFAGDASQNVFYSEVRSVKALFAERFDARERSLILVNNSMTVGALPLANAHNLEAALTAIAGRMDPDEDILFLFLTSHGSRTHELSVNLPPLQLNNLRPGQLRKILDRAGIKWRVIVVSACYSGGFIDPLKDEYSLIMTASIADRNSFGCSNLDEFTYFGQAFFNEQLRNEYSFVTAFRDATRSIAERERLEGLTPSLPQIFIGREIESRLEAFATRLEGNQELAAQAPR